MRQVHDLALPLLALLEQEDGKAAVGREEEHLLHLPEHVREALRGELVGKAAHIDIRHRQPAEGQRVCEQHVRILLRVDVDVEGHGVERAGRREDADVVGEQPVERHIAAVLRERVDAQLPLLDQQHADAVEWPAMDLRAALIVDGMRMGIEEVSLPVRKMRPEAEVADEEVRHILLLHRLIPLIRMIQMGHLLSSSSKFYIA